MRYQHAAQDRDAVIAGRLSEMIWLGDSPNDFSPRGGSDERPAGVDAPTGRDHLLKGTDLHVPRYRAGHWPGHHHRLDHESSWCNPIRLRQ